MNVSLNWLSSYIDLEGLGTQEMADMLTFAGIEVEGIQERGVTTELVVVAQVMEKTPVEGSDHLNVCMVDAGEGSLRQIVCGAQVLLVIASEQVFDCNLHMLSQLLYILSREIVIISIAIIGITDYVVIPSIKTEVF